MGLSDELKKGVASIWEQVATHPFVTELGDNTLSDERFRIYFDQDYIFLKDWAILLSLATAKAPNFDAARPVGILSPGLQSGQSLHSLHMELTGQGHRYPDLDSIGA